jgi:hypothetical protein
MHRKVVFLLMFIVTCVAGTTFARRPELRFLKQTDLPNSGIRFKLMSNSSEMPLPPPMTATYTLKDSSGTESRKDMYSPFELWIHDQHAGMWLDSFSNMLSLAVIRYPLPSGFRYHHAAKEDYVAAADKLIAAQKAWNLPSITSWVQSYLKEKNITAAVQSKKPFTFAHLVKFSFASGGSTRFAYAFMLNRSAAGQQAAPQHWFFVYIEADSAVDPRRAALAVEKEFLKSVGVPAMSSKHKVAASKQFQSGRRIDLSGEDKTSAEFQRSRKVVKQSIANLQDWWFVETKNFIILSNLKSRYRSTLNYLQKNIEHLRYAYELMMPPAKPITAVSVIRVPGTSEEYKGYVGPQYAWSGGLWMAARRELVIRPAERGSSKQKKEQMLSTTYHEGFHQYLFYALGQVQSHPWFNEGHACFFEAAKLNNTRFVIGEHKQMAKDIDDVMKRKAFNVSALIEMDYKKFYAGTDTMRRTNYASAWLLVYYLRKHAPLDKASPYSHIAQTYYTELMKTKNQASANKKAFEGVNMQQLQTDITKFWDSRNMRVKARYNALFKNYKPGARK